VPFMRTVCSTSWAFRSRPFAIWLALLPLLLRATIPVGWMPETVGGTMLVICTAQGLSTIILDPDEKPVEPTKEDGSEHETAPCIFGATAHYFAPDFGEPCLVRFAEFDRLLLVRSDLRLSRVAFGPQQARAPPRIS
jgi:hypothetical protein